MSAHDRIDTATATAASGGDPLQQPMATGHGVRGQASGAITYAELADRAFTKSVPSVAKEAADWFIPSALTGPEARNHAAQRQRGAFAALVLDIDSGGHAIETVEAAVRAALGAKVAALLWSTKSATAADPRWRVVVPLAGPLAGSDYADTAEALCELVERESGGAVVPDRAMCRPGQIAFLPNLPEPPEGGGDPFYDASELPGKPLVLGAGHPIIALRERRRGERHAAETLAKVEQAERRRKREEAAGEGRVSLIDRFNAGHPLADLLSRYGYENRPDPWGHGCSDHWRSRHQRSGSYATRTYTDEGDGSEYWVSLSASDAATGIGAKCGAGRWGDAFDLFAHYDHGGDREAAQAAWTAECDRQRARAAAEAVLRAQAIAAGGMEDAPVDAVEAERLAALGAVETDDASLAAGWLADEGEALLRADDGGWRRFDGGHWQRLDDDGARAALSRWLCDVADLRLAMADLRLEAGEIDRKAHDKAKALRNRLRSTALLDAVYRQARARAAKAAADSFDADPMLLGIPGGRVIDLRTGEARQGLPEDRVSLSTTDDPAPPGAVPERWLRFIGQIADGREGWDVFLQRLAGYCLTGSTDAQSIFFLHGAGANGKSVLRSVLHGIAGVYGRTASAGVFLRSHGAQHPTALASLAGRRLVLASELPKGRVWNDELVKDITGGEPITARFMHRDEFEFTARATVIVTGNHKPSFAGEDAALERRMVLVEFRRVFAGDEIVPGLAERLLAEEGPAILRWMIDGAVAWIAAGGGREGLAIPRDVLAAGRQYAEDEDIVRQFLLDRQWGDPNGWSEGRFIATDGLYAAFRHWLEDSGLKPWSKTTFGKQLASGGKERYGLSQRRTMAARGFTVERMLLDDEERAEALASAAARKGGLTLINGGGGGRKEGE